MGATDAPSVSTQAETVVGAEVTIEMNGRRAVAPFRSRSTLLHTVRAAGFTAPASCEAGSCASCMARVTAGAVRMFNNEALTSEDLAEGWILTCQAVPVTPSVTLVYE